MATQYEYNFASHGLVDTDVEDDEVYQACGGPGSITDIWRKFELIPTPPLSPSRQTSTSGASSPIHLTSASSAADTLQTVSDILDVDSARCTATALFADNGCANPNLKSNLIQDCMWGSHVSTTSVEKKPLAVRQIESSFYDSPCSTPPTFLAVDYVSSECVDPTSVFPYHINNHDFASDSSEDEIDVVSVTEKPVKRKASSFVVNKAKSHSISSSDESQQPDEDPDYMVDEPATKKPKTLTRRLRAARESHLSAKEVASRLAAKEKFEDPECKRNVHNVLERKRRNDLKYSFQVLRDTVPELVGSERAPKVSILKKATECILELQTREESLLKQKDLLEKRHESLLRKLRVLERVSK